MKVCVLCKHCRKKRPLGVNDYCVECVELASTGRVLGLRGRERCLVDGCQNYSDQGKFVRSLCSPCHDFLSNPSPGRTTSQAYLNEQRRYEERVRALGGELFVKLLDKVLGEVVVSFSGDPRA